MRILFKILALLCMSHTVYAAVIYGVDKIQDKYRKVQYPAYVQMGSFASIRAAERLRHQIQSSRKVAVKVQSSRGRFNVIAGPFRNQSALKAFAGRMPTVKREPQSKPRQSPGVLHVLPSIVTSIPALEPVHTPVSEAPVLPRRPVTSVYPVPQSSYPELSVFVGGSYIPNTIKGQTLQLMPYEIGPYADTFSNQSSAGAFSFGVDAKYRFMLHAPSLENDYVDALGAGIDFFQITDFNQTGKVFQFNMPEFQNYTYTLGLNNIRIMADFDLDFHPIWQYFIPFIEGGIGGARTIVSYNSVPISPVISPNFTLVNEASWNFAYQVGAGLKYAATQHLALSLRYLYANMGTVNSSTIGSTTTLATPLRATMSTQNFLFGLTYLVA